VCIIDGAHGLNVAPSFIRELIMRKKRSRDPDFFTKSIHRTELDGPLQGSGRMLVPFKPTAQRPMILSVSEIAAFLRCRLKWNWQYRVGIQSQAAGMPRVNGILVHAGKEEFYKLPRSKRTPERMKVAAQKAIGAVTEVPVDSKVRDLSIAMLVGLAEWCAGDHDKSDKAIGKRDVKPEWPFCLPITKDRSIWVRGKVDEIFEPSIYTRVLAMDETKTKGNISFDMLDLNAQMSCYLWAMNKQFPRDERGRKYRRYIAWRTVCRRQMPTSRVSAPLFGREMIERNPDELRMWLIDTRRTIRDMMDAAIYPTKTDQCRWDCDFYKLCLVRSNKQDLRDIIQSEYITK
jgi:hypothetical protein